MKVKKLIASILSAALIVVGVSTSSISVNAEENVTTTTSELSASKQYVAAMGAGWNLGNTFDGVDTDLTVEDKGEEAWGNPVVTRELIHSIKEKGFKSIRIPLTLYHRFTENNGVYTIDSKWLARYKEVVDWAVEEGLYVLINIHHDSWIWLNEWNGDTKASEYVTYTQLWEQLAAYLKDEPEQVCFETINEPQFSHGEEAEQLKLLESLNKAAYDIIRKSGGNNDKRMIVMPTLNTNDADTKVQSLLNLMQELNDPNLIATVHYYSEWVYSANLGITEFDESLGDDGNTPRKAADKFFSGLNETFVKNGFGVIVGEYGLLGYDKGDDCLEQGEELKYYEYMGKKVLEQDGINLMFWDNGSGIDRLTTDYSWKKPLVGTMIQTSMKQRSSYATGLDTIYFNKKAENDIEIPLTLNGNTFTGIEGATQGTDYTYNEQTATITLNRNFVNEAYDKMANNTYGTFADLTFTFSAGASWHEYLVKHSTVSIGSAKGTTADGIEIPVTYNGSRIRRMAAYGANGKIGPQSSWWKYLEYQNVFYPDYQKELLVVTNNFFTDDTVKGKQGPIRLEVEFYDGNKTDIWLAVSGDTVTSEKSLGKPSVAKINVKIGKKKTISIKNLADGANVSYKIANKKIAAVTSKGVVKGKKAGKTKVLVTVTQCDKTYKVNATVQVKK